MHFDSTPEQFTSVTMASSSSRRSSSPFRFRRPSSLNGRIPGFQPASPSSMSSPSSTGRASLGGGGGRSLTPSRSRNQALMTPPSMKYSFNGGGSPLTPTSMDRMEFLNRAKESISVTVRFRPLSSREIQRGDEVAWYADGDTTVRSEYHLSTFYMFDRVFGPATTTRGVYDIAAQHVVAAAMQGVNGTVFAYGVTSSGKTHTMHGDQKSPGIIPLAVKDVFSIIQDTPGREFLLRVSYLEIYNEVINDLLDPAGQNLRVREDAQGTYVEGIKEEVVLSPAHALSLIAAGEEHRHVGSNNFNLFSSRSHTIFTLTIESSCPGDDDEVTLSQLNLIDLAGSESSKTETTGLRRKEGSYINKSLLTLGTVISKLSDGKASHIPYRDSKLTRLLQSSLSGHGRISLICTITPASSSTEETHNTLKFAQRAKRVELHAAPNRILDEKSLIKKYQREITNLKQELEQLRRGILETPFVVSNHEDLLTLRQQLEAGHLKMQSRLEEEEQAKAALMGRIQRLTKLILVSTKNTIPLSLPEKPQPHRRRHSFGEEELAYLPDKRRDVAFDDEDDSTTIGPDSEVSGDGKGYNSNADEVAKEEKKSKRRGMLGWFKLKRHESLHGSPGTDSEHSPNGSVTPEQSADFKARHRQSFSRRPDETSPMIDPFPEATQAGELFSATVRGRRPPPTGTTMADQMDLLREQMKMLAGEVAFCTSSFKRLSEQAANNPEDEQLQIQMIKLKDEIQEKKRQMSVIEKRIIGSAEATTANYSAFEMSQTISKLISQLNEKAFELEIRTADNRILQEQLQSKTNEINELQDTVLSLRQEVQTSLERRSNQHKKINCVSDNHSRRTNYLENSGDLASWLNTGNLSGEVTAEGDSEASGLISQQKDADLDSLRAELMTQAAELEKLKQDYACLLEEKDGLYMENQSLGEEALYAKELASAAAVELKHLAEEVTKLSAQNSKLKSDLVSAEALAYRGAGNGHAKHNSSEAVQAFTNNRADKAFRNGSLDEDILLDDCELLPGTLDAVDGPKKRNSLENTELQRKLEEAKQREVALENDLANMWVLVAKLKKEKEEAESKSHYMNGHNENESIVHMNGHNDNSILEAKVKDDEQQQSTLKGLRAYLKDEKQRVAEMEAIISHLKSENLDGLDLATLEDLQNLHVEALTKLCHAKTRVQAEKEKEREKERDSQAKPLKDPGCADNGFTLEELEDEDRGSHVCKICFESPTAAVLLPCRHFCLCKPCAVACTECPLCRSSIADRIITYTS